MEENLVPVPESPLWSVGQLKPLMAEFMVKNDLREVAICSEASIKRKQLCSEEN